MSSPGWTLRLFGFFSIYGIIGETIIFLPYIMEDVMPLIAKKQRLSKKGFIDHVKLFTDGACKGNPGPGAVGVMICDDDGNELLKEGCCVGHCTNNIAEYKALIKGLNLCAKFTRKRVTCFCDSELVVKQMNGAYRIKADHLLELFKEVKQCETPFEEVVYTHPKRGNKFIQKVDKLANETLQAGV
jgi:ribonuclease HI